MPALRPRVRWSEQLRRLTTTPVSPMSNPQRTTQGRTRGQMRGTRGTRGGTRGGSTDSANVTNTAPVNIPPATTSATAAGPTTTTSVPIPPSKFIIKWESGQIDCTFPLVAYLVAHRADSHILFSDNKKKNQSMQDDNGGAQPSSKDKGRIHAIIVQEVFAKDEHYSTHYKVCPQKFAVAVANRLTLFTQTGSGVDPTDPQAAANLREDVLRHLPTYDDLNELWHTIPSYAPKAFSSDPQVDHSSCLLSIVHTKSAPASISSAISHLGPDGGDANELDGNHSQDLPPPSTEQPPSIADNDDQFNYDMLDDGAVDEEANTSGGEMNADDDKDYDMAGHETGISMIVVLRSVHAHSPLHHLLNLLFCLRCHPTL
ncbi:hypothetical protein DFJ58DRAFT_730549 [Suillus subalutaceus]|uniref:uncharacterized protein n=1 Tax=Suillus subalutaceus TaxID=48586 RepID=UPI001B863AD0|nr:uncharacterized protein DFJ58DRAFT_730549 [Suillus subalutaceus]KAG1846417.1 hypothetical protein DFJ58DRAFT_730549 [Suillus subalutaceus]